VSKNSKSGKSGKSAKQTKATGKKGKGAGGDAITKKARAEIAERLKRLEAGEAGSDAPGAKPAKAAHEPKVRREPKPKRVSLLDAAAQVLVKSKKAMKVKEIVAAVVDAKLWSSPNGKTPEATLHAAMTREIATKGEAGRFLKVDRGLFGAKAA